MQRPLRARKPTKRHEAQAETEEPVNQISDPKVARKRRFTPCSDLQRYTASAGADEINRGAFPLRASLVPTVPRQSRHIFSRALFFFLFSESTQKSSDTLTSLVPLPLGAATKKTAKKKDNSRSVRLLADGAILYSRGIDSSVLTKTHCTYLATHPS
jgi:hypothetical protein